MVVLTLDQRSSTGAPDLVAEWTERLNSTFAAGLRLPFARTVGDEMQGLVNEPRTAVEIVLSATRERTWWVGVGIGEIDRPLGDTTRESRGPAFVRARTAVGRAKRQRWGCCVIGDPDGSADRFEDCLALLVFVRDNRTARGWELADLAASGLRIVDVARQQRISKQAVSQQLRSAGFAEEHRGRELAVFLLQTALGETPDR